MHTLLAFSSLLLALLAGYAALGMLAVTRDWSRRRQLQLVALAAPIGSLGLAVAGLHHFAGRVCFLGAVPWDYVVGVALPLGMALIALGGMGLAVLRLILVERLVARRGIPAGPRLQALVDGVAPRLGISPPRVRVWAHERPVALGCGLFRPTLLLSTWMLNRLDRAELESVVAHELAHAARRDYLVVWLATMLRDAFFYLPASRKAHRLLQDEKELACDELAAGATRRPLALASALGKVWQQAVTPRGLVLAQLLVGSSGSIESRIQRLLSARPAAPASPPVAPVSRPARLGMALGPGALALAGLLVVEAASVVALLAPMGCGPASPLGMLF